MVRSFSTRSTEAELMDDAAVSSEELDACLRDLARVNVLMRAHQPTIAWLERAARDLGPGDRLSVLDVGFGQGDLLRRIHAWCVGRGLRPDLVGVDLSPWSAVAARAATAPGTAIDYRTGDIFAFRPERPLDVIVSSQFTHHLPDDAVVAFLRFMESTARRGCGDGRLRHRRRRPGGGGRHLSLRPPRPAAASPRARDGSARQGLRR